MSNNTYTFKYEMTDEWGRPMVVLKILTLRPIIIGQCDKAGNMISHKAVMQWTEDHELFSIPEDLVQGKDWDIVECKLLN